MKAVCGVCKKRKLKKYISVSASGTHPYHMKPMFICQLTKKVVGYYHPPCREFESGINTVLKRKHNL